MEDEILESELNLMDPHATNGMTYEQANRYLALKNLKTMFPTASDEFWEALEASELAFYTIHRVFAFMLKDKNVFSLEPSDDLELLNTAAQEAVQYRDWVEGPDDAEVPEFLKWKEGMPSYSMIPNGEQDDDDTPREVRRMQRVTSTDSPRKRAMAIYADHIARGIPKADTIKEYVEVLHLQLATAQVYYSNAKTAANRAS